MLLYLQPAICNKYYTKPFQIMKKCTVMITEDDSEDAEFMRQALQANSFGGDIEHYQNGVELLKQLSKCKAEKSLPEMIILDLNMPLKNGLEVLREMHTDPDYKQIPVAVLTASLRKEDEIACDTLGCKLFIRKPVRFNDYKQIASDIVSHLRSRFTYCL